MINSIPHIISELISPKTKISRLFYLMAIGLAAIILSITVLFSEIKKKDITKNQLEIEKNRISQIDKQITNLYQKTYVESDSINLNKDKFLKEINFLKSQREDAVKSVDKINESPDTQILIFSVIAGILAISILTFFSTTFKSSIYPLSGRIKYYGGSPLESGKKTFKRNQDFLQWITEEEIANKNLNGLDIKKARLLKDVYDMSSKLGDEKANLLDKIINFINLDRDEKEIAANKHSEIVFVFDEIQGRLKEECGRLNKQALINLFICFFIAFILMGYIAYVSIFATQSIEQSSFQYFLIRYIPRLVSVISLLTMFLYFTRLYKSNILDVKYYQNELTNVEIKLISLKVALDNGNEEVLNHIIKEYATVERNSIITKEQTTTELERIKIENELNKDYLNKVWELLSITKNNSKSDIS
jgi:uncharacterized membrane protein YhaH (DUF805 family)